MVVPLFSLLALCSVVSALPASPTAAVVAAATPTPVLSVSLNGKTYINKGLVAFGLIPSNFKESTGDTLGGIGSAIAIKPGSWKVLANGTFSGTFVVHPDRGYNVEVTVDYQARQHDIDFVLKPYYDAAPLTFANAQKTLALTYKRTVLQFERNNTKTSGLDALAVRPKSPAFATDPLADPEMPIASTSLPHLSIDAEGIIANADGSYWISDEYGPYIYRFSASGQLIQTIQPPRAILPLDSKGALSFTSASDPVTGRQGNQGFEGLTLDKTTKTLYAMLQSATVQDGGDDKETSRYTRLVAYNVSNPAARPPLVGEWVVPLPLSSKSKTLPSSELLFLSPGIFLTLSRDGDGRAGDDNNSKYKQADLIDISKATDIHGTAFDDPATPIALKGVLNSTITPATYVSFVDYINTKQLARFGLHNDDPSDQTLIDAKWESLEIAPVGDAAFPDEYFLFTAADNDFISTQGVSLGKPFNAGLDVDNQFLVFRVTLPGVPKY